MTLQYGHSVRLGPSILWRHSDTGRKSLILTHTLMGTLRVPTPLSRVYRLHLSTILCGNSLGAIGPWNQAFRLKGGTHRESNGLSLLVSFEKVSVASSRFITSLHRAHGATGASSLLLGHLYSLFTKMNHRIEVCELWERGVFVKHTLAPPQN